VRYETTVDHVAHTIYTTAYPSRWDRMVGIVRHPIMFLQWLWDKERMFD
jgi:hypothetical protein